MQVVVLLVTLTQTKKKEGFHVLSILFGLFPAVQPDSAEALPPRPLQRLKFALNKIDMHLLFHQKRGKNYVQMTVRFILFSTSSKSFKILKIPSKKYLWVVHLLNKFCCSLASEEALLRAAK